MVPTNISRLTAEEPWCGKHLNEQEVPLKNVYNYANKKDTNDKTPMCRVAELARYNKLKHEYILLDEAGPAHAKRFTVKLVLCDGEEFEGSGASIKKAQQSAAEVAIENSKLSRPPTKSKKQKKDSSQPTLLLNHVANQLGITFTYEDEMQQFKSKGRFPIPQQPLPRQQVRVSQEVRNNPFMTPPPYPLLRMPPYPPQFFPPFSPGTRCPFPPPFSMMPPPPPSQMPQLPRSLLPNGMPALPPPSLAAMNVIKSSYKSTIKLSDGSEHFGEGTTKFDARCNAATKALIHLKPQLTELEAKMTKLRVKSAELSNSSNSSESSTTSSIDDNKENDSNDAIEGETDVNENSTMSEGGRRNRQKSVVSQIHEYALRLKMNVEFEVIQESGEPHKRKYILRCQLSASGKDPIIADGEGTSKKSAKQEACKRMLEKLQEIDILETDPLYLASMILLTNKKTAASLTPKEPKRKTIIKDLKMDPLYGHHINPISRLIQVMQSKKEPIFRLIKEQGQNRYKEFTFEITCRGITLTGSGPNKKLAKRAAAEAMLEHIGYVKPMPQPGKSLLKKKSLDSPSIGMNNNNTSIDIGIFDPNELQSSNPEAVVAFSPSPMAIDTPELSPRPSSNAMETFADVDNSLKDSGAALFVAMDSSPKSPRRVTASPVDDKEDEQCRKRRVTFSNQVSACPPPEDSNYPEASIAPLKSEVVIVSKLKKRGKDSKRTLTPEEKAAVAELCRDFFAYPMAEQEKKGYVSRDNDGGQFQIPTEASERQGPAIKTAKERLESLATSFKFTVAYSDFPKTADSGEFSLVSIGLEKPIVRSGMGDTYELAHNDAAFNALNDLTVIDAGNTVIPNILPAALSLM